MVGAGIDLGWGRSTVEFGDVLVSFIGWDLSRNPVIHCLFLNILFRKNVDKKKYCWLDWTMSILFLFNMPIKYSDFIKKLQKSNGREFIAGADAITHYFQTKGEYAADAYIEKCRAVLHSLESNVSVNDSLEYDVPFPPPENPEFSFIDLFAGIGGFRIAFQEQGGKCVFSSEWDKYAQKTYAANFGEVPFGDISEIEESEIPDHDILLGGFPCQPFSIAGVSKKNALGRSHGFLDKTQGTLFFDIARIIEEKRPKAFVLENVKNLRSHDKGNTFKVIEETLEGLGYSVQSKILDARYYVPQHRERIFIVGFDKSVYGNNVNFQFPQNEGEEKQLVSILERKVDSKYTLTDGLWLYLKNYADKHRKKGNGFGYGMPHKYNVTRTLSARYYKDGSEILISQGKNQNPRRLTPNECKRLMGFPEGYVIKDIGVSDTQLYKQFGNSVAVPVVSVVAESLLSAIRSHSLTSVSEKAKKRQELLFRKEINHHSSSEVHSSSEISSESLTKASK